MQPATWRPSPPPHLAALGLVTRIAQDVPPAPQGFVTPPRAMPAAPMMPRPTARPTILVIDDDASLLELLALTFADALPDADVRLAACAREGERAALAWTPDVILCDVHLPDEDGRHLMGRLRARTGLAHVPGVLMTGLDISSRLLREEAAAVRAELLRKPFDLTELLRLVARALAGQVAV
jgi:CheY-like chemotaxis protein